MSRIIHTPINFEKPIDTYYYTTKPHKIPNSRIIDCNDFGQYIMSTPSNLIVVSTVYAKPDLYLVYLLRTNFGFDKEPDTVIECLDEVHIDEIGGYAFSRTLEDAISAHLDLVEKIEKTFAPHAKSLPTTYFLDEMHFHNISL